MEAKQNKVSLYQILEVNKHSTKKEIREAYKRLISKHHPDKNKTRDDTKFKEIKTAYDILYNDQERRKYDTMNEIEQWKIYDVLKECINNKLYNSVISIFYDNENDFENDVNDLNFSNILNRVKTKIETIPLKKNNIINLDIDLLDIYLDRYQKINIDSDIVYVPLREQEVVFPDKNITVKITPKQHSRFKIVNDVDLFTTIKCNSNGSQINKAQITHIDGEVLNINLDSNLIVIKGKGLPYSILSDSDSEDGEYEDVNLVGSNRGDLLILVK